MLNKLLGNHATGLHRSGGSAAPFQQLRNLIEIGYVAVGLCRDAIVGDMEQRIVLDGATAPDLRHFQTTVTKDWQLRSAPWSRFRDAVDN